MADRIYKNFQLTNLHDNTLEMISNGYFEDISEGLKSICKKFTHYDTPQQLIDNIKKHKDSIVFTVYGGHGSRNRMALVPAICESYGIKFAGADAYARIVCQDKYLSKLLAKRFKLNTAKGLLIDKLSRLEFLNELALPIVIKPNLEGSSIGISDSSLANTYEDASKVIENLYSEFKQPILVEEFIPGKEICVCILGTSSHIDFIEAMEVQYQENVSYFYNRLYTAYDKHVSGQTIIHTKCTEFLSVQELVHIKELYFSLGKMDFMRIDGRLTENGFTLIELTPDAYIGSDSSFADAGVINGFSYESILSKIIHNALTYYHIPCSNYIKN